MFSRWIDEPVTGTGLREDQLRTRRIPFELPTKLRDVHVHVVRLLAVRRPPDLAQDRSVRQELAGVAGEQPQDLDLVRSQVYMLPRNGHLGLVEVDRDVADGDDRRPGRAGPLQHRTEPRQE